jgi:hypothetical protein
MHSRVMVDFEGDGVNAIEFTKEKETYYEIGFIYVFRYGLKRERQVKGIRSYA